MSLSVFSAELDHRLALTDEAIREYDGLHALKSNIASLRMALERILVEDSDEASQRVSRWNRFRDRLFHLLFIMKGRKGAFRPKRRPKLQNVVHLLGSTLQYGFEETATQLKDQNDFFDEWPGSLIAEIFMTRFIAGKSLLDASERMAPYRSQGVSATYALEIEGEHDSVKQRMNEKRLLRQVDECAKLEPRDRNCSLKLTALGADFHDDEESRTQVYEGLLKIIQRAREKGVFVTIDMEEYCSRDATVELYQQLIHQHPELQSHVGIVVQAYLKDSMKKTEELFAWAREKGRRLNIRLVKGAYLKKERDLAEAEGRASPICDSKEHTDEQFLDLSELLFKESDICGQMAFGTMNPSTVADVLALQHEYHITPDRIEFQQLFGMMDPLMFVLRDLGYQVRKYVPYADRFSEVISYFLRRLTESPEQLEMIRKLLAKHDSLSV